jgi:hypothetical protein
MDRRKKTRTPWRASNTTSLAGTVAQGGFTFTVETVALTETQRVAPIRAR